MNLHGFCDFHVPTHTLVPRALQLMKTLKNAQPLRSCKARGKPIDTLHGDGPDGTSKHLVRFLARGYNGDTVALRVHMKEERQPAGRGATHVRVGQRRGHELHGGTGGAAYCRTIAMARVIERVASAFGAVAVSASTGASKKHAGRGS